MAVRTALTMTMSVSVDIGFSINPANRIAMAQDRY